MSLSFQEKSLWLMLVSLGGAFGFYFYYASGLPTKDGSVLAPHVALFFVAVAMLVVAQVVGHVLIVIVDRRYGTDERDRIIGLKGTRNAAYVLATGVCVALYAAVATKGNFVFTHVLLASWVVAQMVEIASQLILYRRGA